MIHLACQIPTTIVVACSGGPDSMALLDFCIKGRRNVQALYIKHGDSEFAQDSQRVVTDWCAAKGVPLLVESVSRTDTTKSQEQDWSDQRREIYMRMPHPVLTGHHLDDAVEWWLLTCMRGQPTLMKSHSGNVLRPFLWSPKSKLLDWCAQKQVEYLVDPTNKGESNDRSKIRVMMNGIESINPGIRNTVLRLLKKESKASGL